MEGYSNCVCVCVYVCKFNVCVCVCYHLILETMISLSPYLMDGTGCERAELQRF